jgi:four helix bundle protein
MSTISKLEELNTWQLARTNYNKVSVIVKRLRELKEFRFAEQMKSSAGSIMDNIAEGFDKIGRLEFVNSLGVSKGECGELKSQLYRCLDDGYITEEEFTDLYKHVDLVSAKIAKLIDYLNACELKGLKYKGRLPLK